MPKSELIIRNYDPRTHYPDTALCMQRLGFFRDGQDTAERMRGIVESKPDAIRVAHFAGSRGVEACMHIPDSLIPAVFRQGIHPDSPYPVEISNAMYNDAAQILRSRGALCIEDLIDVDRPLPDMSESPALVEAAARGFQPAYSLVGVTRNLWLPDGWPTPDLPIGDMFTVRTEV